MAASEFHCNDGTGLLVDGVYSMQFVDCKFHNTSGMGIDTDSPEWTDTKEDDSEPTEV